MCELPISPTGPVTYQLAKGQDEDAFLEALKQSFVEGTVFVRIA